MRLAGDSDTYTFRICSQNGFDAAGPILVPSEHGFELPSVTAILSDVMGKPAGAMSHWGYNLGIEGMLALAQVEENIAALGVEEAKTRLKDARYSPNQVRDSAGERGNNAHKVLELLCEGRHLDPNASVGTVWHGLTLDGYCMGVLNWWVAQSEGWRVVASEVPVWSLRYGFCGSLDLAREDGEGIEIVDLKTHKPKTQALPAYVADLFQLTAYRIGWEETRGQRVDRQRVLVVDEKGRYFEDTRTIRRSVFADVCAVYRELKALGEDNIHRGLKALEGEKITPTASGLGEGN